MPRHEQRVVAFDAQLQKLARVRGLPRLLVLGEQDVQDEINKQEHEAHEEHRCEDVITYAYGYVGVRKCAWVSQCVCIIARSSSQAAQTPTRPYRGRTPGT